MNYKIIIAITALSSLLFLQPISAMDMNEGMWEITTRMEMPGMPMEMPAIKNTQCLTSKDSVPQDKDPNAKDCKIEKTDVQGDTITWEVHCISDGKPVKSTGRITYKGDTFDGETIMAMDGMNVTQKMKGHRIGDCK